MLRYQENNELHRDFHGTTNTTIRYITEKFGEESLRKILRKTGRDVYKSIREKLARGDASELIEHLTWFFNREGGEFTLTVKPGFIRFEVHKCPAWEHVSKLGLEHAPGFCLQTEEINNGMCEGTPWKAELTCLGDGRCVQTFTLEK